MKRLMFALTLLLVSTTGPSWVDTWVGGIVQFTCLFVAVLLLWWHTASPDWRDD